MVTFECLTGRLPFDSAALGDLFSESWSSRSPCPRSSPRSPPPSTPGGYARRGATPSKRFQSAKELVDGLNQAFGLTGNHGCEIHPWSEPRAGPRASSAQAKSSSPHDATAFAPLGGARPLTAGPVVAALSTHQTSSPPRSVLAPVIAGVLSLALVVGLVLFALLRPTGGPVAEGAAATDPGRDATAAPPSATAASPSATAASPAVTPSAVAPSASAAAAPPPSAKAPPALTGKLPAPGSKPLAPPVKPKRPDFGI